MHSSVCDTVHSGVSTWPCLVTCKFCKFMQFFQQCMIWNSNIATCKVDILNCDHVRTYAGLVYGVFFFGSWARAFRLGPSPFSVVPTQVGRCPSGPAVAHQRFFSWLRFSVDISGMPQLLHRAPFNFCFLKKKKEWSADFDNVYFAKNDHRWVTFIS